MAKKLIEVRRCRVLTVLIALGLSTPLTSCKGDDQSGSTVDPASDGGASSAGRGGVLGTAGVAAIPNGGSGVGGGPAVAGGGGRAPSAGASGIGVGGAAGVSALIGGGGAIPQGGGGGSSSGFAGAAGAGLWSCGTAAGVCTCVSIDIDAGPLSGGCNESDCCFVDVVGTCTCRLAGAAADCGALMEALNAAAPVATCPP